MTKQEAYNRYMEEKRKVRPCDIMETVGILLLVLGVILLFVILSFEIIASNVPIVEIVLILGLLWLLSGVMCGSQTNTKKYGDYLITNDWEVKGNYFLDVAKSHIKGDYWLRVADYNIKITEKQLFYLQNFKGEEKPVVLIDLAKMDALVNVDKASLVKDFI